MALGTQARSCLYITDTFTLSGINHLLTGLVGPDLMVSRQGHTDAEPLSPLLFWLICLASDQHILMPGDS